MALQAINTSAAAFGLFQHNQVVPGVESISLFQATTDVLAGSYSAGVFSIVSASLPTSVIIKGEKEKSKMTYSLTQEKGFALYNISIEMFIPMMSFDLHTRLEEFRGKALMCFVDMHDKYESATPFETDGAADDDANSTTLKRGKYLVGWDSILGTDDSTNQNSNFCMFLDSIESDSGAALADKSGVTLKFSCVQGQAPLRVSVT